MKPPRTGPEDGPILFKPELVVAIYSDRKTVTRRVNDLDLVNKNPSSWSRPVIVQKMPAGSRTFWGFTRRDDQFVVRCPFGEVGDRLWVREIFSPYEPIGGGRGSRPAAKIETASYVVFHDGGQVYRDPFHYYPPTKPYDPHGDRKSFSGIKWRPSIHMPRWASRLTLEIVSVRIERLQEITEAQALAEGLPPEQSDITLVRNALLKGSMVVDRFARGWDEINGHRNRGRYKWKRNPYLWVIEFKRLEPEKPK